MRTFRSERMNGALKAVEGMSLPTEGYCKRLIVVIVTNLALLHDVTSPECFMKVPGETTKFK